MKTILTLLILILSLNANAQGIQIILEKNAKIDSATERSIRNTFNFQLQYFSKIFNGRPISHFKARIFPDEKSYFTYSRKFLDFDPLKHNADAFYDHKTEEMVLSFETENFNDTFAHELCHALYKYYRNLNNYNDPPMWLTEGLAMLLEDIHIDNTKFFLKADNKKIGELIGTFNEGRRFDTAFKTYSDYEDYLLGWSGVFYLYNMDQNVLNNFIKHPWRDYNKLDEYGLYPGGAYQLSIDSHSGYLNSIPNQATSSKP